MMNFFKRLFMGATIGLAITLVASISWPWIKEASEQIAKAHENPFPHTEQTNTEQTEEPSLPAAQVIEQIPGPIPQENLTVKIIGQRDGLVGDLMYFSLEITGTPDSVEWSLDPPVHGFHVLDGRRNAVFSNRDPGVYELYVSVGGDKRVAHDKFRFAIDAGHAVEEPVQPVQQPQQQFMPMQQQMMQQQMPPNGMTDWKGAIKTLATRVVSNTRNQEGITLAGCFREVANELRVGTFSGADPWVEVSKQGREALGADYVPWQVFFRDLGLSLLSLHQRGVPNTPQQNILLLEGAAEGLGDL